MLPVRINLPGNSQAPGWSLGDPSRLAYNVSPDVLGGIFIVRKGGITDVVSIHVVEVHTHGRNTAQFAPLGNVFGVRLLSTTCGLNIKDIHTASLRIETGVIVFDLEIPFEGFPSS